ncbi:MAG: hypothetical protein M1474_02120 [Candidatus Marsarchaeota archaeon]|jgi:NADH:ubiquinone oxidoreductase subunit K|nr:hypothetical protein [Candidatus Marsarchaeota archaeon]
MIQLLVVLLGMALFSVGAAGVAASRHFVIIILSVEVMLVSATIAATGFFFYYSAGNILLLLFAIWGVAAVEAIALVAFYHFMLHEEASMDVTKLSKLRG